ncbi:MAG: CvpA family protein [Candidatus Omnitrophica bacterium]|nr:CvpA family protein [Candidatus Omnitrophota bacterium]MCM8770935.1 CvpA family protein [Candidatus Omnitrophota bacterium]
MFIDLAKQFNWLDFFFVILLIRICYISQERGALVEAFKVLGVVLGILISFENFNVLGNFIQEKLSLAPELINFVCFVALLVFGYFISLVFRDLVLKFIKIKEKLASPDRFLAVALGLLRVSLIFSLVLIALRLSGPENFRNDTKRSYLGGYFINLSPKTHSFVFNLVVKKLRPDFMPNKAIEDILK